MLPQPTPCHGLSWASALRVNAPGLVALGSHSLEVYLASSPQRVAVVLVCKQLAGWPQYTLCLK